MKYEIISYDVWGNKSDGFTVNQAFHTGIIIDIDPNSDTEIIQALKRDYGLKRGLRHNNFKIDGEPDHSLYVDYESQKIGYLPVCELQRIKS